MFNIHFKPEAKWDVKYPSVITVYVIRSGALATSENAVVIIRISAILSYYIVWLFRNTSEEYKGLTWNCWEFYWSNWQRPSDRRK